MNISIYTDGACSGNHSKDIASSGGIGIVMLCYDDNGTLRKERHISKHVPNATNNITELLAAIEAIKIVSPDTPMTIYSDSQYVIKGITEWISNWKKKGWKGSNKKPIANRELWQELDELNHDKITWTWLKGHDGHPEQEMADTLAVEASTSKTSIDNTIN